MDLRFTAYVTTEGLTMDLRFTAYVTTDEAGTVNVEVFSSTGEKATESRLFTVDDAQDTDEWVASALGRLYMKVALDY